MSVSALPFACAHDDGSGSWQELNSRRVTQCALSRVCGSCGQTLARPIAFVGTEEESGRNAFHFPPLHLACADALVVTAREQAGLDWSVVTTSGFEFVRPGRDDPDRRPTFQPNSLL